MRIVDKDQQRMRQYSRIFVIFYYAVTLGALIYVWMRDGFGYLVMMSIAAALLPLVPKLIYRAFRLDSVPLFELIFNGFALIAVPFASVLGGYNFVPYLDKILHCASGFLFAVAGMLIFYYCKPGRSKSAADAPIAALFAAAFSMSTAVLWEIYEYVLSLFGPDPQLVALTGVGDTMQDMIVCAVGGILTAVSCYRYLRGGRAGLMMSLFESFYKINIAPPENTKASV